MNNENKSSKNHGIIIENRKKAVLTGVKEVESFNENDIVLITQQGGLKIKGKNLEINKVSVETGDLEMTGIINAVIYSDVSRTPNNFITKLFR